MFGLNSLQFILTKTFYSGNLFFKFGLCRISFYSGFGLGSRQFCSVEFYRYIFTEEKDSCIQANLDCSAFFDILI
jgi:hypothetical protein